VSKGIERRVERLEKATPQQPEDDPAGQRVLEVIEDWFEDLGIPQILRSSADRAEAERRIREAFSRLRERVKGDPVISGSRWEIIFIRIADASESNLIEFEVPRFFRDQASESLEAFLRRIRYAVHLKGDTVLAGNDRPEEGPQTPGPESTEEDET